MLDFKIEIGETVVINDIKISRINKLHYVVNNNDVKLKKKEVLSLVNGECDIVDIINRHLEIYNKEYRAERIDDECFLCDSKLYIRGANYISTYDVDDSGENIEKVSEDILKKFYDKIEGRLFDTLMQSYNSYPKFEKVHFIFYSEETKSETLIRHCTDSFAYDDRFDYVYATYDKQISDIVKLGLDKISNLFGSRGKNGFFTYKSSSVENMWKTRYKTYYNEAYELIKGIKDRDELERVLNNYYNSKKEAILNEIDLIMRSEEEYKRRSEEEAKKRYTYNYTHTTSTNENRDRVREMVKGMTYKQACKLLHPDICKIENAKELFQELQANKDRWFDGDGNWCETIWRTKGKSKESTWDGRDRRKSGFPF